MIDRVAGNMLSDIPWPPTARQAVNIGIALGEVGVAMWLWQRAGKGGLTLKPWQLRAGAVLAGAAALWAIYHVRVQHGIAPAPQQIPAQGVSGGYR